MDPSHSERRRVSDNDDVINHIIIIIIIIIIISTERPREFQIPRFCAAWIQRLPATRLMSSVHLVGGRTTLRLPGRCCHSSMLESNYK
ncbi:jg15474 [Pararge aegeria aegeria]|uniref:Jg15474 protein n=1 Tax=Pararge aegeria aegeria TaxID=348720 RepID=A0A8S4S2Y0_9NEOP|nr:jg15474 [Pararge aegeria aegeria]